jgi:hypothetical protein
MAWNDMWSDFFSGIAGQREGMQNAPSITSQTGFGGALNTATGGKLSDLFSGFGDEMGRIRTNIPTTGGNTGVPINASSGTPYDWDNIWKQAKRAYGSDAISQYYNLARGNLNRSMGNASSFASRAAGAAGTNMVNPSSFIQSAISQAQGNFAPQYGQLAASQAQAQQQGQAQLTQILYLINRAKQGDQEAANQLKARYDEGAESVRQFNAQREDAGAGLGDYLFGGIGALGNLFSSGLLGSSGLGIFGGSSTSTPLGMGGAWFG